MALITMSRLGTAGQWGNNIFQYAFIRVYARRHNLSYQIPVWAGRHFFGLHDPPITVKLPPSVERLGPCRHQMHYGVPIAPGPEHIDHDWLGWGQYHTNWYAPDKPFIQELFQVTEEAKAPLEATWKELSGRGRTVIGLHLRRGDSGRLIFFFTPIVWCLKWLRENWPRFTRPVLFLATEDLTLKRYFEGYGVVTVEDLGIQLKPEVPPGYIYPHRVGHDRVRQLDFFPDWWLLQQCPVVVSSESTFSFTAAWTGTACHEFWRPRLSLRRFERVDPWDTETSPREHLDDFRGIPGTQIDRNPEFPEAWSGFHPTYPSVPEDPVEIERWMAPP